MPASVEAGAKLTVPPLLRVVYPLKLRILLLVRPASTCTLPAPAESCNRPMVCVTEATVGVTSSNEPPAKVLPSKGSVLKIRLLVVAKRLAPLPDVAVCLTCNKPPPTVTVPVKLEVAPKVIVGVPVRAVLIALLIVTVLVPDTQPVTTLPVGMPVPDTASPTAIVPVTVPTTKVLVLDAPPEAYGADPPAR